MGGFLASGSWAFIFLLQSPSLHGENAPIYSQEQILVLAGLVISSMLGLAGSVISRRNIRTGGILMLVAGGIAFTSLLDVFGLLFFFFLPSYGSWAIVLLIGGLFGAMTRIPKDTEHGMRDGSTMSSKSL
jgi:hypothetical protein